MVIPGVGLDNRPVVLRKVKFFGISVGGPPHGTVDNYDPTQQLIDIDGLEFLQGAGRDSRYLDTDTGQVLFTNVDHRGPEVCFRLCRVDRDNLPQTEKAGDIEELLLDDETGIARTTYGIVLEPGLLGVVSAKEGPSMSGVAKYLKSKGANVPRTLTVSPLVHKDIIDKLRDFETLSLFHLRLHPSQLPIIRGRWNDLDANLDSQLNVWREQKSLETVIAPTPTSQRRAYQSLINPITSVAELAGLLPKRGSKLLVKGQREGTINDVVLNLLSETLTVELDIVKSAARSSALDIDSAYNAIRRGYNDLRADIENAMGIGA